MSFRWKPAEHQKCVHCGETKPLDNFATERRRPFGKRSHCKACHSIKNRAIYARNRKARVESTLRWKRKNVEHVSTQMKGYRRNLRQQVINGYGGACTCCGEREEAFLTIEHLNRDGHVHRKLRGTWGIPLDIIRLKFPAEYTILCMNCNWAKRLLEECPHVTGKR